MSPRNVLRVIVLIGIVFWLFPFPYFPVPTTVILHSNGREQTLDMQSPEARQLLRELRKALRPNLNTVKVSVTEETLDDLRSNSLCLEIRYAPPKMTMLRRGPWGTKEIALAPTLWIPLSGQGEGWVIVVPRRPSSRPAALGPIDVSRLKETVDRFSK